MPSFSIPLTGLESDNTALNTIANNLANMSTVGFKSQTTDFADLLYQQFGASGDGNPIQVGTGVQASNTETNFSNGPVNGTQNSDDMAIDGSGFFVVQNGSGQELTRAGDFSTTPTGQLVNPSGALVMGYPAVGGVVNTNAALGPLTIPIGQVVPPNATTTVSLTANLDAGAKIGTAFPAPVQVYDSLGVVHNATVNFTKTAANTWSYSISLPAGDAASVSNATGSLTFNSSGVLTSPTPSTPTTTFAGMTDGAANLSFSMDTTILTQVSDSSTITNTVQDGYTSGQFSQFTVSSDGTITAQFSNGVTNAIGQLAIATVGNDQGLDDIGGNLYTTTRASGEASLGWAGAGGRGTIEDSSLESSNVDISTEFSNLIVAQRAFEANSKAITTFDTVTQEAINMIH